MDKPSNSALSWEGGRSRWINLDKGFHWPNNIFSMAPLQKCLMPLNVSRPEVQLPIQCTIQRASSMEIYIFTALFRLWQPLYHWTKSMIFHGTLWNQHYFTFLETLQENSALQVCCWQNQTVKFFSNRFRLQVTHKANPIWMPPIFQSILILFILYYFNIRNIKLLYYWFLIPLHRKLAWSALIISMTQ